jgi:hypothetical protein
VQHAAQRVEVAARVGQAVLHLLGRHVRRRAEDLAHPREPDRAREDGEAEVEHDDAAVRAEHEVGRGEVAVHDLQAVRCAPIAATQPGGSGPCSATTSATVTPSTNCITWNSRCSCIPRS